MTVHKKTVKCSTNVRQLTLTGFVAALINGNTVAPPKVTSLSCSSKTITVDFSCSLD